MTGQLQGGGCTDREPGSKEQVSCATKTLLTPLCRPLSELWEWDLAKGTEPAPCHRWAEQPVQVFLPALTQAPGKYQMNPRMTITATVFSAMCLPDAEHRELFVPEALLPQAKLPTATREVIRFPFSSPPHLFMATMLSVRIYINCPLIYGRKSKIQFGNP